MRYNLFVYFVMFSYYSYSQQNELPDKNPKPDKIKPSQDFNMLRVQGSAVDLFYILSEKKCGNCPSCPNKDCCQCLHFIPNPIDSNKVIQYSEKTYLTVYQKETNGRFNQVYERQLTKQSTMMRIEPKGEKFKITLSNK